MTDQSTTLQQTIERNHAEAVLDVLYGVNINLLSSRLYRRIESAFSLVNVVGGSVAFATILTGIPVVAGTISLIIATLAYWEREIKPGQKAIQCQVHAERFGDLAGRAATLSLHELDAELRKLQSKAPDSFDTLRTSAYNDNVRANGFPQWVLPQTRWEKLVRWLC